MKPNRHMNGGWAQNAQSTYYVDDDAPRQILTTSNFWEDDGESAVMLVSVVNSSANAVYHSDVLLPEMLEIEDTYTIFIDDFLSL